MELFDGMNKAIRTGALIKELAKAEINSNVIFSDESIERAIKETKTNDFTRIDIEFNKALLIDEEYQKRHNALVEEMEKHGETGEIDKEKLIRLVDLQDERYNQLKEQYYK